jgi:hypothetical protein
MKKLEYNPSSFVAYPSGTCTVGYKNILMAGLKYFFKIIENRLGGVTFIY